LLQTRGTQNFQKSRSHLKILGAINGDIKQVPYRGPTNIALPSKILSPWRPSAAASNRCTMQGLLTLDRTIQQ